MSFCPLNQVEPARLAALESCPGRSTPPPRQTRPRGALTAGSAQPAGSAAGGFAPGCSTCARPRSTAGTKKSRKASNLQPSSFFHIPAASEARKVGAGRSRSDGYGVIPAVLGNNSITQPGPFVKTFSGICGKLFGRCGKPGEK